MLSHRRVVALAVLSLNVGPIRAFAVIHLPVSGSLSSLRRFAIFVFVALLCPAALPKTAFAQEPCVSAPLFSGNVVLMPQPSNVSWQVQSMVVDDFTGDGNFDIVLGDQNRLIFYRGRNDWWDFDPRVFIPLPFAQGTAVLTLATADLNTDGKRDLVLGNTHTSATSPIQRVHVMLGNGNGTFQPPTAWGPNVITVYDLDVADFDGDTKVDVIFGASAPTGATTTILWGEGDGTFAAFIQVAQFACDSRRLDVADIDGDGDTDAIVGSPANILRNNGDGTFVTEPLILAGGYGYGFGELNGDNRPDIIIASTTSGDEAIYTLQNDGTGHYPAWVRYPLSTHPEQSGTHGIPVAADLDGDGKAEVIIGRRSLACAATQYQDHTLVFRNAGDGTLVEPPALYHSVGAQGDARSFAAADLNHDGRPDLLSSVNGSTTLLLNDGDGGFLTARGTPMGQQPPAGECGDSAVTTFTLLTSRDINNDDRFDLVGVRESSPFLEVTVLLQDTQGTFTTLTSVPLPSRFTQSLALDDFDRDENLDVVVTTKDNNLAHGGDAVRVALGYGDGTFQSWDLYHSVGKTPWHVAAGDLNGDLYPDLVVATRWGPGTIKPPNVGPQGVSVFLNNGDGTFADPVHYDCGDESKFTAIADVNNDTHPDLAVLTSYNGATVLLNNGDGTFGPHGPYYADHPEGSNEVVLADVNGNGSPDMLVCHNYFSGAPASSGGVSVLLNNGSGTFVPVGAAGVGTDYRLPVVADLDSDGVVDLVTVGQRGTHSGVINIHMGNGDGTFTPGITYGGGQWRVIVADFDADGRPDLGSPLGCSPDWDLNTHVGFARLLNRTCESVCYPDCTGDGALSVADFGCFQGKYVLGDPYADCNASGNLTVADFGCFQGKYVLGCP